MKPFKWRCPNDIFGYCYKEPDWDKKPVNPSTVSGIRSTLDTSLCGGSCLNNARTCSFYQTFSQSLKT